MTPITAWAIKAPDGAYFINTHREDKEWWIRAFPEKDGYRCVRVTVQEMQE